MMTTKVSQLRKSLTASIDNVIEYNDSILVLSKKGNVVIISEYDYNTMLESVVSVSQKDLIEIIKDGEKENPSDMSVYHPEEEW